MFRSFQPIRNLLILAILAVLLGFPGRSSALPFGINKVRYHDDLKWGILETEHFEIYHTLEGGALAQDAARFAEASFRTVSRAMEYVPKTKIPLFIYGDPLLFQETNITPGYLPEGVGGFTEVFKNRIAVPMTGSYQEFQKVIQHEMMHAFQYDLLYGEGWRSLNLFKTVFVPQWMMEGSAEWIADHWESQGEMVLRDAVLNDQLIPLSLMESFDHFGQVYLAYKESQSILEYVSQVYGRGRVPQMFKLLANNQSPDAVSKKVLGIPLDRLYSDWSFYLKGQAWSRVNGMASPEKYGEELEGEAQKSAVSPDGTKVACLSGKELILMDPDGKARRSLAQGRLNTQGSGVVWSPDGKTLAYSANPGGRISIYLYDLKKGKRRELEIPGIPWAYSPQWSRDGRFLVLSGFDRTTTDLFRFELATGRLERLTQDKASETWACFSPEGDWIYWVEEEGGETRPMKAKWVTEGPLQKIPLPEKGPWGHIASLHLAPSGLFFTSDRGNRIFNLYFWEEGKGFTQLTRSYTDILSAAPDPMGMKFYACLYRKGRFVLKVLRGAALEKNLDPPVDLSYLANSFQKAAGVLGNGPVSEAPLLSLKEGMEKEGERIETIPTPSGTPGPVEKLEVEEASNIVRLHWSSGKGTEQGVTEYRIYRSKGEESAFELAGKAPGGNEGTFVDYEVKEGEDYLYEVTAFNPNGESPPSSVARARTISRSMAKNYDFNLSPDILLFIAGYDSNFGFVGGGIFQFSDYLGDHRLSLLGDTIPGVRTGLEAVYECSLFRTKMDVHYFYYENFFRILELQTGGLVDEYRNNENGAEVSFEYPVDESTRFEYGVGTQRFKGGPSYLRFSEGLSNYFGDPTKWNIANYYRLSFVQDHREGRGFSPSSGYGLNLTLLHALSIADSNVSFANILFETQEYADLDFLNHMVLASRMVLMSSQGPQPQTFFIGNDAPFQAYFTTLRGYGGKTFYGKNLGLLNLELRYPLAEPINLPMTPLPFVLLKKIELAGFLDVGIVGDQVTDLYRSPVLGSGGVGLRFYNVLYQRALVLLRFDIAWRLDHSYPPTLNFNLGPMF